VKKWLWTLLALAMFLPLSGLASSDARAEEVQFELLGKLGGAGNSIDKISLGDPSFDVAGGLSLAAMFRFEMGIGIGLNFNWTMTVPLLDQTQLTYALDARKREMTIQHPSIGLVLRYQPMEQIDLGFWMNYGFGSASIDYDTRNMNNTVAEAYRLNDAHLDWELQTFELGLMGAFVYKIKKVNIDVLIGLQAFFDFSRMVASDDTLRDARDISGRHLEDNSINTAGFNIVFGARYDLVFGRTRQADF